MLEQQTFQNKDLVLKISPNYDPKRLDPNKYERFLYDLGGRQVAVVAQGFYTAGNHTLILTGEGLASGVYLLRLTASGETLERTMVLSR